MVIYEDTRQQAGKHDNIHKYCEEHNIKIVRTKLDTGDYSLPPQISVDTKKGLAEVYQDLVTDHDRFHREYAKAALAGIKLYFLIEEENPRIRTVYDVNTWVNPLSVQYRMGKIKTKPRGSDALQKQMLTVHEKYGVEWVFCHPSQTGEMLIKLLYDRN